MCDFTFDPDLWPKEIPDVNEIWECPYPAIDGYSRCIFHLFPQERHSLFPDPSTRQQMFEMSVEAVGKLDLVCTNLERLDLDRLLQYCDSEDLARVYASDISEELIYTEGESKNPVYIYQTHISDLDMTGASILSSFYIYQSHIGNWSLIDATFNEPVMCEGNQIGNLDATDCIFRAKCYWCRPPSLVNPESPLELENLGKEPCEFSTATFTGAEFQSYVYFAGVKFSEWADFLKAEFHKIALFDDLEGGVVTSFRSVDFHGPARFKRAELGACDFREAEFYDLFDCDQATFGNEHPLKHYRRQATHALAEGYQTDLDWLLPPAKSTLELSTSEIGNISAVFDKCIFHDSATFNDVLIKHGLSAREIEFQKEIEVRFEVDYPIPLMFHKSSFRDGTIHVSEPRALYEFTDATIGDLDFTADEGLNPFEQVLFQQTNFDGFDFRNYRSELRDVNWSLQNIDLGSDKGEVRIKNPVPIKKEATYSKAKTAAESIGDSFAASKFFIKECRARRTHHRKSMESEHQFQTAIAGYRYVANILFDGSCKYAESSGRIVLWSIGVIAFFAMVYSSLDLLAGQTEPSTILEYVYTIVTYFIFSIQAFSAFILPGGTEIHNIVPRFLAAVESFIGAFAIGLFVATIVRSVKR